MKLIVLMLFNLFICKTSFCIVILTQSNLVPNSGESLIGFIADTSANEGAAGAGITWNYDTLSISSTSAIQNAVTVSSTPLGGNFTNANIAIEMNGAYTYYNSTNSRLELVGEDNSGDEFHYTPVMEYFTFPFTYNSNCGTSNFTASDSYFSIQGSNSTTGDATGTLIINNKTFPDVLRVKNEIIRTYTDITFGYNYTIHSTLFCWYDGMHKNPILQIGYERITGIIDDYYKTVIVGDFVTGLEDLAFSNNKLNLFPNPASSFVTLSIDNVNTANYVIKVYDIKGVKQKINEDITYLGNEFSDRINVSDFAPGFYLLEMINDREKRTLKFTVL